MPIFVVVSLFTSELAAVDRVAKTSSAPAAALVTSSSAAYSALHSPIRPGSLRKSMNVHGEEANPEGISYPFDVCIATGQVSMLVCLVSDEFIYVKPYNAKVDE
jgi:hypothetical protein